MAILAELDECFNFLPLQNVGDDFDKFWKAVRSKIKAVPLTPEYRTSNLKTTARFEVLDCTFKSIGNALIHSMLYLPRYTEKPKPIIVIHDYNNMEPYKGYGLDEKYAYLFLRLRGHTKTIKAVQAKKNEQPKTPGFFNEGLTDKENCYMKNVYCDALRSIDMLRLNKKLDCGKISIIGKGIGAAAALFCARNSDRVVSIVLDSPGFCYIDEWINQSEGAVSYEISNFIDSHRTKKEIIRKNLSYFDALNFTDEINCKALMVIGLKDKTSPIRCSFALFNSLQCEKNMEIYPDDGNEAGSDRQFLKSLKWITRTMKD